MSVTPTSTGQVLKIGFKFNEIYVPLLVIQECILELKYESHNFRFNYPQSEPFMIPIYEPLTQDNKLELVVLLKMSNKYRKIAKGVIHLYKRNFAGTSNRVEKWVQLDLFTHTYEEMGKGTLIRTALNNLGKIYMHAEIKDEVKSKALKEFSTAEQAYNKALKDDLKVLNDTKEKATQNKTDKFKSIVEGNNEFLRNLKKNRFNNSDEDLFEDIMDDERQKDLADGLSDISVSIIDGTEENHLELNDLELETNTLIQHIRTLFEENKDDLLPRDEAELKQYCSVLIQQFNGFSQCYFKNLENLDAINKHLKTIAKGFYDKYKELKHSFLKERKQLHVLQDQLEKDTKRNVDENFKLKSVFGEVTNEFSYLKKKLGKEDNVLCQDNDIISLCNILNEMKDNYGINIFDGMSQNDEVNLRKMIEHYSTQNYPANLRLLNKIDRVMTELENERLVRRVDVKHDYENGFYFGPHVHVTILDAERLKVVESETGAEYYLDDWLIHNFKPIEDKKKRIYNLLNVIDNYGAKQESPKSLVPRQLVKLNQPQSSPKNTKVAAIPKKYNV